MPDPSSWIFVSSNSSLFGEGGTSASALQVWLLAYLSRPSPLADVSFSRPRPQMEKQGLRAVRHALATAGGVSAEQWEERVQTDSALLGPQGEGMRRREAAAATNGVKKDGGMGGGDRGQAVHEE
jgi:hypothetical protein